MTTNSFVQLLRPTHWIKNVFVFAPLFFDLQFFEQGLLIKSFITFCSFCVAASAVYVFNDIQDIEFDRSHPTKQYRPIASGQIAVINAYRLYGLLLLLSVGIGSLVHVNVGLTLLAYIMLNVGYSVYFKHVIYIDVLCIALGFLLRLQAGAAATSIELSYWIISLTFLLSYFLGLSKRRSEVLMHSKKSKVSRKNALSYNIKTLDRAITITLVLTSIIYIGYTTSEQVMIQMDSKSLYTTAIWVLFGLGRYIYLVFRKGEGGSPVQIVLSDIPLQLTIALWIANFFLLIY